MLSPLSFYRCLIPICVLTFTLCMMPSHRLPNVSGISRHSPIPIDKAAHFLLFFAVSSAAFLDHSRLLKSKISAEELWGGSLIFPVAFGGAIELAQRYFTSTRNAEWNDWLADIVGAAAGFILCRLINRRLSQTSQEKILADYESEA